MAPVPREVVPVTEIAPAPAAESDDAEWHNGHGEAPDHTALTSLQLAYRAVAKFPELARRYQKFIGTAAVVSSALIILASIAVSRRQAKGESADRILAEITPDEIEHAKHDEPSKPKKDAKNGRYTH
jgi:hypothetical protein